MIIVIVSFLVGVWVGNAFSNNYTKGLLERAKEKLSLLGTPSYYRIDTPSQDNEGNWQVKAVFGDDTAVWGVSEDLWEAISFCREEILGKIK